MTSTPLPAAPFDHVAREYDRVFTDTPLGCRQRLIVHRYLAGVVTPGARVLELNCGTGEDALWLAERTARVVATDISGEMIDVARRKADRSPFSGRITFRRMPIEELQEEGAIEDLGRFDLILSNFDGLNCLRDLSWLPTTLAALLEPGGNVVLVFMNPVCMMEILFFLARGRFKRSVERLRRDGSSAHIGNEVSVRTYFHPVHRVREIFGGKFLLRRTMAVGLTTPPTLMRDFYHRHRSWFARLFPLEEWLSPLPPFNRLGDHVLLHFQLRER
jgi:2-polyprenyl-3-methyl-5-hydroxy-6-metoxy-1,4-benzoquinol methylase